MRSLLYLIRWSGTIFFEKTPISKQPYYTSSDRPHSGRFYNELESGRIYNEFASGGFYELESMTS